MKAVPWPAPLALQPALCREVRPNASAGSDKSADAVVSYLKVTFKGSFVYMCAACVEEGRLVALYRFGLLPVDMDQHRSIYLHAEAGGAGVSLHGNQHRKHPVHT